MTTVKTGRDAFIKAVGAQTVDVDDICDRALWDDKVLLRVSSAPYQVRGFTYVPDETEVVLNSIAAKQTQNGHGQLCLDWLISLADKHAVKIILEAKPYAYTIPLKKLLRLYSDRGFKIIKPHPFLLMKRDNI